MGPSDLNRTGPGLLRTPLVLPGRLARVADRTDGEVTVPPAAAEQHEPRVIELPQPLQVPDCLPEHRAVVGLVEQAPNNHARVVSVTADHLVAGPVKVLSHPGRVPEQPRRSVFLVNHQAELVAEAELVLPGYPGNETDRVVPGRFGVHQVLTYQSRVLGHGLADRVVVAGVRGPEIYPATVQFEPAVADLQLPEPGPHAPFVRGIAATLRLEPDANKVEERVVDVPRLQFVWWYPQFEMDAGGLAGLVARVYELASAGYVEPGAVFAYEDAHRH